MNENPFGITREEMVNLAATKLADSIAEESEIFSVAERQIEERVKTVFETGLKSKIDAFLEAEMQKIVGQEIVPVNIWGEREGKPTTIKAELAKRAAAFWSVKVDDNGRESGYGGKERSIRMMESCMKDAFIEAIKSNLNVIVSEFAAALKTDASKLVAEHIERLIKQR